MWYELPHYKTGDEVVVEEQLIRIGEQDRASAYVQTRLGLLCLQEIYNDYKDASVPVVLAGTTHEGKVRYALYVASGSD